MTVSSEVSTVSHTGDGVTKTFAVPFPFLDRSDLTATIVASYGEASAGSFTASGAGSSSGGSITLTTAPAVGLTLRIDRDPAMKQITAYTDRGRFPSVSHEQALDRGVMISQAIERRRKRNETDLLATTSKVATQTAQISELNMAVRGWAASVPEASSVAQWLYKPAFFITSVTVNVPADAPTIQDAFDGTSRWVVPANAKVTIQLAGQRFMLTQALRWRTDGANFRVVGATTLGTGSNLLSVASVAAIPGVTGGWRVTYDVTSAAGIAPGHEAMVRALFGRIASPISGRVSTTSGSPIVTGVSTKFTDDWEGLGSGQIPSDTVWRIKIGNRKYDIASINSNTQLTLATNALDTVSEVEAIRYVPQGEGDALISVVGDQVIGSSASTNFLSSVNVGDNLFYEGGQGQVKSIESQSALTLTAAAPINVASKTWVKDSAFGLHEGSGAVYAVDTVANTVTVDIKLKSNGVPPPRFGVLQGALRVNRTVIEMTANVSGIEFSYGSRLGYLDRISIIGTGAGDDQVIAALNVGRDAADTDSIITGDTNLRLGPNLSCRRWVGSGVYAQRGTYVMAQFSAMDDCGNAGWLSASNCELYVRSTIARACGRGYMVNNSAFLTCESGRASGNKIAAYAIEGGRMHAQNLRSHASETNAVCADKGGFINAQLAQLRGAGSTVLYVGPGAQVEAEGVIAWGSSSHVASIDGGTLDAERGVFSGSDTGRGVNVDEMGRALYPYGNLLFNRFGGESATNASFIRSALRLAKDNGGFATSASKGGRVRRNGAVNSGNVSGTDSIPINTLAADGSYIDAA